ncbi:hypothetical protein FHG89_06875 [Micromonospora orduensis]|uniref:Nucleotidyltransferase family protein n=1 Tax=Micromonospora orduensis TaxID=1420891 RepID=A0A5C4QWY7_9ACTN|nr:nucleotidyltransferase family protein [Micromonospora orduensis]TNH30589.1 hypothetical protein FHG89_06875 [Micromonospora orduensis]
MREIGPTAAAEVITRHKVRRITRRRVGAALASASGDDAALLQRFDAEIDRLGAPRETRGTDLDAQVAEFRSRTSDLPVRLMKGLGVRSWYPAGQRRDIGDADLWVPDMDSGLQVASMLRDLGFTYEPGEMPWLKRDMNGTLLGQFRMQHPAPDQVDVDIHIGPYSVRYCGLIEFDRSRENEVWTPLADEDNFCAVIGNAAGDCFIEAKAINDVVLAASRPLDFGYVVATLRQAGLTGFLNTVVDRVQEVCDLRDDQRATLRQLRTDDAPEDVPLAATDDDIRRTDLVTAHTRRVAESMTGDAAAAERIARNAEHAYGSPRSFRLRTSGGQPHRLPDMNPWTCVRLAPQPLIRRIANRHERVPVRGRHTRLAENLELIEVEDGDLLRFRDDVFLPTVDYLFCSKLVVAEPEAGAHEASA